MTFTYSMKDEWLKEKGLEIPDIQMVCLNEQEIRNKIGFPEMLFAGEYLYRDIDGSTCLCLWVDEEGDVENVDFASSYLTNGTAFGKVAYDMKFLAAFKDGKPIKSCIYIIATFETE